MDTSTILIVALFVGVVILSIALISRTRTINLIGKIQLRKSRQHIQSPYEERNLVPSEMLRFFLGRPSVERLTRQRALLRIS